MTLMHFHDTNAFPGRNGGKKMWKRKQWTNPINMVEFFGGLNTSIAVFQAETSISRYVRVVKETDLKSVGLRPCRFEPCCRWFLFYRWMISLWFFCDISTSDVWKIKQLLNRVLGKNILHEWELWSLIVNYITISFSAHSHMVSHLMTPFYNV